MPPVTNAQLADRIDVLSGNVCTVVETTKEINKGFTTFQLDYERRHSELSAKVMEQETKLQVQKDSMASLTNIVTQQSKEIGDLKDVVKNLQTSVISLQDSVTKIIGWVNKLFWAFFVPFILGLISVIIGLLTHTIVITFPK